MKLFARRTNPTVMGLMTISLVALTMVMFPARASADPSVADVHRALGIDRIPADYVILVDISGSMRGARYAALREGLRGLLAAVAPQDQVSLVTFAAAPTVVWQGDAGRSPDAVLARLPADANGTSTDIGKALEKAVDILSRAGAPTIGTVVLLTDGRHEPAYGSPYPYESGFAWDRLRESAGRLKQEMLTPFAIPLAGVTGAPLLGRVFANATILDAAAIEQTTRILEKPQAAVQAAKVRQLLSSDLTRGVTARWDESVAALGAGATTVPVILRSDTTHIPLVVDQLTVASSRADITARIDGGPVELASGEEKRVTATVEWDPGPSTWKPFATTTIQANLTITARVSSPWSAALTADGIPYQPQLAGGAATGTGQAQSGRPGTWLMGLLLFLVVIALAVVGAGRRRRPSLTGSLAVVPGGTMPLRGREASISDRTLGIGGKGTVRRVRAGLWSRATALRIVYTRTGLPSDEESQLCAPGEVVSISGVDFVWRQP